jgi:hypothetical protein
VKGGTASVTRRTVYSLWSRVDQGSPGLASHMLLAGLHSSWLGVFATVGQQTQLPNSPTTMTAWNSFSYCISFMCIQLSRIEGRGTRLDRVYQIY